MTACPYSGVKNDVAEHCLATWESIHNKWKCKNMYKPIRWMCYERRCTKHGFKKMLFSLCFK